MGHIVQPWAEIDWRDQAAHAVVGFILVFGLGFLIAGWVGVLLSMLVGVARELVQHPCHCHAGCRTDLVFWAVGSMTGLIVTTL